MDSSSQTSLDGNLSGYKTPLLKLARRFKGSLDLWKAKYQELKADRKRFQNQAHDARLSRDQWKQKAEHWKAQALQLQAQLDRLPQPTAGPNNKPPGS